MSVERYFRLEDIADRLYRMAYDVPSGPRRKILTARRSEVLSEMERIRDGRSHCRKGNPRFREKIRATLLTLDAH